MRVAAIQHDVSWLDPAGTHAWVDPLLATAADQGVELAVCPEMFATGFSMDADRAAQPMDGPTVTFLRERASTHRMWIGASVAVELPGSLPVNRFVMAGPDGQLHHYDKRHPFSYADEHLHYGAGEEQISVDLDGCRVTPTVCYDLRFADDYWATASATDLYLVVANWPAERQFHWSTLLTARAIENQAYVLGVNRVGTGDSVRYVGGSACIDPMGAPSWSVTDQEAVLVADVDPAVVAATRARFPFMADRRPRP